MLPLAKANGQLKALANYYTFRLRPVLIGSDSPQLLRDLARDLTHMTRRISLDGVGAEDGSVSRIEDAFGDAGWLVLRELCSVNHILEVNNRSYSEYLASRPGQLRTTLKRKAAKVRTLVLTAFDYEAWQAYEDIYRESWKPGEGSPAFLRAFAAAEGAAGRLRLGLAYADGVPVAAQLWTVEAGTAWIHKLAHTEASKPLSPGTTLSAALFAHVIDQDRVTTIDFGTGDDRYKRDWMEVVRARYRLDIVRPLHPGNWPIIARATLRRLARAGKPG